MDKLTELCEFLAWVQDNYTESGEDCYEPAVLFGLGQGVTREEVVTQYLSERGGSNG